VDDEEELATRSGIRLLRASGIAVSPANLRPTLATTTDLESGQVNVSGKERCLSVLSTVVVASNTTFHCPAFWPLITWAGLCEPSLEGDRQGGFSLEDKAKAKGLCC
jgi:hypothetical protein